MADCFISYRRTPSAPVATTLQSMLESKHGLDVYVDTTRTDGTRVRFPERLMQAIEDAPVFVCLLGERDGEHTLESEWVLKEIQQAYDLGKFCIPVFQESYRPLTDIPPAVDYLLGFDGVHILDQKNIMIDESVRKIAELIRPQRKKPVSPAGIGAAIVLTLTVVVAGVWVALSVLNPPGVTPTLTSVAPLHTPTDIPAAEPSLTATQKPSATPTATLLPTELPLDLIVGTLDKQATHEQGTANAAATVAARGTDYAVGTQESLDGTATATLATNTPTPNVTASIEAYRTERASTLTQEWIDSWTATPSSTHTPTITPTPTATQTPSITPTLSPEQIALTPQTSNADWSRIEREFDGVIMVLVPTGCFRMGSNNGGNNEQPVHEQCFDQPFWMDKYEVTQAQFRRLGGTQANPSSFNGINLPVENITWYEAHDFCEARGGSLPSEAEWEYAARGPRGLVYPWGVIFSSNNIIYKSNSEAQTHFVASRPNGTSWVGAFHMSGNVWEWTRTVYRNYPYSKTDDRENTDSTAYRVARGGSWNSPATYVRAAHRAGLNPNHFNSTLGFRCMRPID